MAAESETGTVVLQGALGFNPGEFAGSPHGCMTRILEALGESLTYDDLVCYSGFAFRVGLHVEMCPSAGHPCCGYVCMDGAIRILPRLATSFNAFPWDEPKEDRAAFEAEACAAIRESIDRGVPVHYVGEEDGLIVGYADEGRRWLCVHPYHKEGKVTFWHDEAKGFAGGKWPWAIVVWTDPVPPEDRADLEAQLRAALEQAVDMWQTPKKGDYYVGEKAYDEWLQWLARVQAGEVEDPKAGMQGNGWVYDVLVHSRTIAGRWLRGRAATVGGVAGALLTEAADHYTELAKTLMDGLDCPWDLALPPHRAGDWTPEMRAGQIERLEVAREKDRQAVEAIRKALELLD